MGIGNLKTPNIHERPRVGFYGCSAQQGRLVRIGVAEPMARGPRTVEVDCPVCMHTHDVKPTWRPLSKRDEGIEPDLMLVVW